MTDQLPPPPSPVAPSSPVGPGSSKRRGRPAFGAVVGAAIALRGGREVLERVAFSRYGFLGVLLVGALALALVIGWRADQRRRARKRGGVEFTPEVVQKQLADSGLGGPAFAEDGSLLGASVLVVNQRPKILEVETAYEVFGSDAAALGSIRQIGQSRFQQVARVLTAFDQYLTHHFEVLDTAGRPVLRLTRPWKVFLTKMHVFDGNDVYLGTIRQENVFWKIRFQLLDPQGRIVGRMHAKNVRAWDFQILDLTGREVAMVVKSWEGWARTAFTRADRYVVRVHEQLAPPLRQLAFATALTADMALKQDARGIG